MSDAVRSYRSGSVSAPVGGGFQPRRGFQFTRLVVLVLAALCVYAYWISRDTHRIEEFISADAAFQIVAQDIVENRLRLQSSSVWEALPEQFTEHSLPRLIQTSVNLPEWVQRNLVGRFVFVSGADAAEFSDAVYVTRLSRVGSLLERTLRWTSGNASDPAGGLKIRHLSENGLYYTTRGRIALLSESRRALIHALTLDSSEVVTSDEWDDSILQTGDEDFRGTIRVEGTSEWAGYFSAVGFALRLEPDKGLLKLSMPCTDAFYSAFGESLRSAGAQNLIEPNSGPLRMSVNLNGDIAGLWHTMSLFVDTPDEHVARWEGWVGESNPTSTESYLAQMLTSSGPGIAMTWQGYELDAIVPRFSYSLVANSNGETFAQAKEQLGSRANTAIDLRFDDEYQWIEAVGIGGPESTAVMFTSTDGRYVLASTSKERAVPQWTPQSSVNIMNEKANLFVQVAPGEVVEQYARFGNALVEDGLLEGYTPTTFNEHLKTLRDRASGIQTITLLGRHVNGIVEADIVLDSAPE